MDELVARALLHSLLQRLDADALRNSPQFSAAVSQYELAALHWLLDSAFAEQHSMEPTEQIRAEGQPSTDCGARTEDEIPGLPNEQNRDAEHIEVVGQLTPEAPESDSDPLLVFKDVARSTPIEELQRTLELFKGRPGAEAIVSVIEKELSGRAEVAAKEQSTNIKEHDDIVAEAAAHSAERVTPSASRVHGQLDQTALSHHAPQDEELVLCLDFGTAKSKAFAASVADEDDGTVPQLIELGLGRSDADIDGSAYTVASSVWVADDGLVFVGSEALRRSMDSVLDSTPRRRLDSIKQQLTLVSFEHDLRSRRLEKELNPTAVELTYEDAICFYLAYLTDLAVSELASGGRSRYLKRRFTIPSWQATQRSWAAPVLARYTARAQMLADTFHGRWREGIPADELRAAVASASACDDRLMYLLDSRTASQGLLEPLAAGSGRVWADARTKHLMFVLDVGAGTTDFSLFWVVQNIGTGPRRKAFPIAPYSDAIRMAGDIIDEILLGELLARAHGSSDALMRTLIEADLRRRGLRRLKERLFVTGKLEQPLATDQTVSIELEEFLKNERVCAVGRQIENAIGRFLSAVHVSWREVADRAILVLTGGGANMPIIRKLSERLWDIAGRQLRFEVAEDVPDLISSQFDSDFQREYPQLAVAIGGALPVLDEKTGLDQWWGSQNKQGPLSRYQVTGM